MFHLPCGEMTPTLQDVTFLVGLPCAGFPLAAHDIPATWRTEFLARFQGVLLPNSGYREFSSTHGPLLQWICQFYPERMAEDACEYTVRRHFEVYLLWLFEWVMFLGSYGDSVDNHFIRYARQLADWEVEEIQPYAWGPAVLCATYRSLCDASRWVGDSSTLFGCPLLLQLWSFERF